MMTGGLKLGRSWENQLVVGEDGLIFRYAILTLFKVRKWMNMG
jgi:hypothetical protein